MEPFDSISFTMLFPNKVALIIIVLSLLTGWFHSIISTFLAMEVKLPISMLLISEYMFVLPPLIELYLPIKILLPAMIELRIYVPSPMDTLPCIVEYDILA
jgi:hypothetical protein